MKRILVGVDGSAAARDALGWAADLARRAEVDLIAVRVFTPTQAEMPPDHATELHRGQLRELQTWCEDRPEGGVELEAVLLDGAPADALLEAAAVRDADLLVVGGRGEGGFTHLHLGSVAHHLVHHTTVPLAVVPTTGAVPVRHLVVGVDGSSGSLAAVELCAELAAELQVGVTAVHAAEALLEWAPADDPESWRRRAEIEVRDWTAPISEAGTPLEVLVERDLHPVAAIMHALGAHPGSAAVVGARGLGGFSGLRLGRVPLQLLHHSGAAVVVVPPQR